MSSVRQQQSPPPQDAEVIASSPLIKSNNPFRASIMAQENSPVLMSAPPSPLPLPSPVSPLSPTHPQHGYPAPLSPIHLAPSSNGLPQEPRRSSSFHNASPGTTIAEEEEGRGSALYASSTLTTPQPTQGNTNPINTAHTPQQPNQFLTPGEHVAVKKTGADDQIFITIQPGSSSSLTQVNTNGYQHRFSIETVDDPSMWPPRKFLQKKVMKKKRVRIALKVTLAIVIIVGAAAIGLGINKAVQDGKKGN